MSHRRFLLLLVVLAALTVGARLLGEWVRIAALAIIGLAGLYGFLRLEIAKHQFVHALADQPAGDKARVLHALENVAERVELAARLGHDAPVVTLRGGRERFAYSRSAQRQASWTMWGSALMATVVIALGATSDFGDLANLLAWLALAVGFAAGALVMRRASVSTRAVVEVDEEALHFRRPDGRTTTIAWPQIRAVMERSLLQSFSVQGPEDRVTVWQTLEGYGRLVNIVATRLPERARWKAT